MIRGYSVAVVVMAPRPVPSPAITVPTGAIRLSGRSSSVQMGPQRPKSRALVSGGYQEALRAAFNAVLWPLRQVSCCAVALGQARALLGARPGPRASGAALRVARAAQPACTTCAG